MVKLNLLDIPESQQTAEEKQQAQENIQPSREEIDFSFFQADDDAVSEPPPPPQPVFEVKPQPESPPEQPSFAIPEGFSRDFNNVPRFDDDAPGRRVIFWVAFAIALAIIAGLVYWFFLRDSQPATRQPVTTVVSPEAALETPPAETPGTTESSVPAGIAQRYQQNVGENSHNIGYASNFINAASGNAGYSMVVVTGGRIFASIVGNNRDDIARQRRAIVAANPKLIQEKFNVQSAQYESIDGQQMLVVNYSATLPKAGPATGQRFAETQQLDARGVESAIRSMASQNNLRIDYFNAGDRERSGELLKNFYYAKLTGSRSASLNFLNDFSSRNPSVQILKLGLYPASGATLSSGGQVRTNIEFTVYTKN